MSSPRLLLLDDIDAYLDQSARSVVHRVITRYPATIILVSRHPDVLAHATTRWNLDKLRLTTFLS
ncbi:MAG: hypothetical protein JOZ47_20030 [Kutzneria sp.]|nr:hypothetical protein [Kutzneria sp.]